MSDRDRYKDSLAEVACKYGFSHCSFENRQSHWLTILDLDEDILESDKEEFSKSCLELKRMDEIISANPRVLGDSEQLLEHQIPSSYDQVLKDVNRSLWKFCDDDIRDAKRKELITLIMSVLLNARDEDGNSLHYFQGFNDIASVILFSCDLTVSYSVLKRVSLYFLRDIMRPNLTMVKAIHNHLFRIIELSDKKLFQFLKQSGIEPFIVLPWTITWFSYIVQNLEISQRHFDFFISSDPIMPYYLSVAYIAYISNQGLYDLPCEYSNTYGFISKYHSTVKISQIPFNALIEDSRRLYTQYPPAIIWDYNIKGLNQSLLFKYPYVWSPRLSPVLGSMKNVHADKRKKVIRYLLVNVAIISVIAILYPKTSMWLRNLSSSLSNH